jgi:hypothetical protein
MCMLRNQSATLLQPCDHKESVRMSCGSRTKHSGFWHGCRRADVIEAFSLRNVKESPLRAIMRCKKTYYVRFDWGPFNVSIKAGTMHFYESFRSNNSTHFK